MYLDFRLVVSVTSLIVMSSCIKVYKIAKIVRAL